MRSQQSVKPLGDIFNLVLHRAHLEVTADFVACRRRPFAVE